MPQTPTAAAWSLIPSQKIIWMGHPVGQPKADHNTSFLRFLDATFFAVGLLLLIRGLAIQGQDVMFPVIFCGIGGLFTVIGGGILIRPFLGRNRRTTSTTVNRHIAISALSPSLTLQRLAI